MKKKLFNLQAVVDEWASSLFRVYANILMLYLDKFIIIFVLK